MSFSATFPAIYNLRMLDALRYNSSIDAYTGMIMLSVAFAYFLNWNGQGLDLHWAFTVVFGVYLLVAALLGYIGVRKVKEVRAPEKAIAQAQETKQILKRG